MDGGAWQATVRGGHKESDMAERLHFHFAGEDMSAFLAKVNISYAGDAGLIPGSGRSPVGGHGNPLQYSCLENSMDRGARWAIVHGFSKSWT